MDLRGPRARRRRRGRSREQPRARPSARRSRRDRSLRTPRRPRGHGRGSASERALAARARRRRTNARVHSLYTGLDRGSVEPGEHARAFLDDDAIAQVRQSATDHDTVVAVVHVVAELEEEVDDAWRAWATRLVDAGADAIVVHGTHLPMRVERFGARRARRRGALPA
ncbi:MAG: CapA family protein [Polyangiales bacterium]